MKARLITFAIAVLMILSIIPPNTPAVAQDGFNLTVTPGCGYNDLVWDAVPNAAHYWIYRGPGVGMEYATPLTDFPIEETYFRDTINIQNDQLYCYYVRAVDSGANEFAQSIEDCATPTCPPDEEEDDCVRILKYQVGNTMYWVDDGEKGPMEAAPVINQSRMFLLIRYVAEEMGATVDYVAAEKKIIITTTDHNVIEIWIGKPTAAVNGQPVQIDPNNPSVVGYVVNGRTLLPMRFVAENLGATGPNDIKWFSDTSTVVLYFDDPECRECTCMTIASLNTTSEIPTATAVDGNGKTWNLMFEGNSTSLAYKLEVNKCYEICGYPQSSETEDPITTPLPGTNVQTVSVFRVTSIRGVECPCEPDDNNDGGGSCGLCVHVEEVGRGEAYVTDEWGVKWVLFKAPTLQAEFMEGSCINVEGNLVEGKHGFPGFEVTQISEGTCCDNNPPVVECVCVIIDGKTRINDDFFVATGTKEDGTVLGLLIPRDIAYSMNDGECWKVCGEIVEQEDTGEIGTPTPGINFGMKVEEATKEDCCGEPEAECVCVTIKTKVTLNDNLFIMTGDTADTTWGLVVDRNLASDMQIGECWKVCGIVVVQDETTGTPVGKSMRVTEAFLEDCCGNDSNCFCVSVEVVNCDDDEPNFDGYDKNNTAWRVYLSADQCAEIREGQCWIVCGEAKENPIYEDALPYKEIYPTMIRNGGNCCKGDQPPPEDCTWYPVEIFSAERTGTSDLPWKVSIKICGGEFSVFDEYTGSDDIRIDKSGNYKIFDYKGCAKICVVNKRIVSWIALPLVKDCCGNQEQPDPTPESKVCEGKKIFGTVTNRNPGGEGYSDMIFIKECLNPASGMGVMLAADPDLMDTTGKMHIKDIKKGVCGTFCVSISGGSNVLSVDSWTLVSTDGDCCTKITPPKIVVGKIGGIDDDGDSLTVWVSECPDLNENVRLGYNAKKTLMDTTRKYTFQKYGEGKCVILKVKGTEIISWTALDQDKDCCSVIYDGLIENVSEKDKNGDVFVTIKLCDDYNTQFFIDPKMKDIHGQFTFEEYTAKYKHCVRFFTNRNRVVAWQSMKYTECCVDNYDWANIEFNGFTNDANIDGEGAILTLDYRACDEYEMKGMSLMVQPGLRDESGLYSFKTLPPGSCIQVTYTKESSGIYIISWVYKGWGDCCP